MKFKIESLNVARESSGDRRGEPYRYRTKMYIWPKGESILENLHGRHNRPADIWKKEVIPAILEKLQAEYPEAFNDVENVKWGWRQKCGCTCSCSPGFVSDKETSGMWVISATVSASE